jgi:hypothetical protein
LKIKNPQNNQKTPYFKAIKDGSFTVDDIGIVNGTINLGSFTKVSATQYTTLLTFQLSIS